MKPLITILAQASLLTAAEPTIEFGRDVRPILSDACFHCHGFDEETRKAKLRLDTHEGLFTERDGVTPVVPKDLTRSEVITRLLSDDEDEVMPPPKHPRQLTKEQQETLRLWVQQGAPFEDKHWSFTTITQPALPKDDAKWARQPFDHLVLAEMRKHELKPSPEADKATLIRRVTLDLTGLPPTPEEVAAFEKDKSPKAYEALVDRLLKSPRYGERMAVDWLDLARYADTAGYQVDPERTMWPWRDWVVRAFNDNLPFDQFTIAQIAGDLLPNATRDQLIATGFNRNHRMNGEAGSIAAEWHVENVVDRVDATSTVWLGLTMGCARCHDHKYDPLTQHDFYSMFAFFNNVDENGLFARPKLMSREAGKPWLLLPDETQQKQQAVLEKKLAAAKEAQRKAIVAAAAGQDGWEKTALTQGGKWLPLGKFEVTSDGGRTLTVRSDGSVLASDLKRDAGAARDVYRVKGISPLANVTAVRLELLTDPSLPRNGPGLHRSGNFLLSGFDVFFDGADARLPVTATATFEQDRYPIAPVGEGRKFGGTFGWGIAPEVGKAHQAVFELKTPLQNAAGKPFEIVLEQELGKNSLIGCFRISVTSDSGPSVLSPEVRTALADPADKRTPRQNQLIRQTYLKTVPAYAEATQIVYGVQKGQELLSAKTPAVMVMNENKPRDTFMLIRGAYDKPGDEVEAAVPAMLPPLPESEPDNRLGLARWLVSKENPLTARVTVNRLWASVFGRGIVASLENFGVQGDWPTNRPLLDWLADEFMKTWDMKAFMKMLVTSAAYRQQSNVTPELIERDPDNRYLARGPRHRLSAEMIRDQALAVSGLLHEQRGGPPVKPYQPDGLWEELAATATSAKAKLYQQSKGTDLYRRSLYTYWKRTAAPTTMTTFDAPSREICTIKRSRTCTPLQALALMNDVTYLEASRALAERLLKDKAATPPQRIEQAFHFVLARAPKAAELTKLTTALTNYEANFRADAAAAKELICQGESKPDAKLDPAVLAAHTMLASLLLNLDETVTKQ